jgi:hypothetical protein
MLFRHDTVTSRVKAIVASILHLLYIPLACIRKEELQKCENYTRHNCLFFSNVTIIEELCPIQ